VALDADPATATGYRWAGGAGPPVPLTSGTLVEAAVTVRRQAPIGFAIPLLRRELGL
jgi:HlyD family secretion protein